MPIKLNKLKPRLAVLDPWKAKGLKTLTYPRRTLKDKQESNGRTLALDGAAWRKLRAHVLAAEPLCRHCTARGLTVIATEVDHRNGPSDNRLESLQPLCKPCHSKVTMRDMGHNVSMGCATDGTPLDPYHHWNEGVRADLARSAGAVESDSKRSPATDDHKPTCSNSFNANRGN